MKKHSLLFALTAVLAVTAFATLQNKHSNSPATQQRVKDDESYGPIAEYTAKGNNSTAHGTKNNTQRKLKNKRYDKVFLVPSNVSESDGDSNLVNDWEVGLPALPVSQSDAVIVGEVTDAQAFLSESGTGLYSEFGVKVGDVLKNSGTGYLSGGSTVTAQRIGGRLKFPSGKVQRYEIYGQNMPKVGRRYVLFLKQNEEGNDYRIVTGYELRAGHVIPLDKLHNKDQFSIYEGTEESAFLKTLQDAITNF